MSTIDIILVVIIVILLFFMIGLSILFFLKPNHHKNSTNSDAEQKLESIVLQNQTLQAKLDSIEKSYAGLNQNINKANVDSTRNITSLSEKIETMDKFQKDLNKYNNEIKVNLENLHASTKNIPSISSELKGISDIYRHAKNRGNFGEFQLKIILQDIFGVDSELVKYQYHLGDDTIVDNVVFIGQHIVPIDSKFPLDNYRKIIESQNNNEIEEFKKLFKRDIVNKFKEVTKYLSPSKGIDNVIIFIPSEGMFSDIVTWYGNDLLIEANDSHVFLCSPTTITVMLKLFVINEKDKVLSKNIENVKKQISKIFADFHKVAKNWMDYIKNLSTLTNKAKILTNTNTQILKKITRIETDNQALLEDVDKTIEESVELKNQLEQDSNSLREFNNEDETE